MSFQILVLFLMKSDECTELVGEKKHLEVEAETYLFGKLNVDVGVEVGWEYLLRHEEYREIAEKIESLISSIGVKIENVKICLTTWRRKADVNVRINEFGGVVRLPLKKLDGNYMYL